MKLGIEDKQEDLSENLETDISIIASFEHPNVATYETYFFTDLNRKTYIAILRPYFKSNIADIANFTKFTAADSEICQKLIKALNYIHDKYSIILTLKKSNVFIDSAGEVQITDIAIPSLLEYELESRKKNLKLAMY
jgi:serine/threonine protein kinase